MHVGAFMFKQSGEFSRLIPRFGYNELKFIISEAWNEPTELSILFEQECTDMHATQSTISSHCEGLVALVLSPVVTYYVLLPTVLPTEKWL